MHCIAKADTGNVSLFLIIYFVYGKHYKNGKRIMGRTWEAHFDIVDLSRNYKLITVQF
jgi:hypothetical protein